MFQKIAHLSRPNPKLNLATYEEKGGGVSAYRSLGNTRNNFVFVYKYKFLNKLCTYSSLKLEMLYVFLSNCVETFMLLGIFYLN